MRPRFLQRKVARLPSAQHNTMNRLQSELQRLFGLRPASTAAADEQGATAWGPAQPVSVMVMALTQSATWKELSQVWRGVQGELGLPAPAIAVAGAGGMQLWFSLAEPVAAWRALAFLDALRARFLPDVQAVRIRCASYRGLRQASTHLAVIHDPADDLRPIPAPLDEPGHWAAFVASDLVAVFEDTPWLDVEPSEEGQATLLRGLAVMENAAFEQAFLELSLPDGFETGPQGAGPAVDDARMAEASGVHPSQLMSPSGLVAGAETDPRRFLLQVMNDSTVALSLRVEAAKALLQHAAHQRPARHD